MTKIILITGGNKGIGFQLARMLLESAPEFSTVILTARNESLGLRAVNDLGGGARLDFHQLDITNDESITHTKDYVSQKYGQLDVLVNNAAVYYEITEKFHTVVRPTIATNLTGSIKMTDTFLPIMSPNGHILNISSLLGNTTLLKNPELAQTLLREDLTWQELEQIIEKVNNIGEDWALKGWNLEGLGVYGLSKALLNAYSRILARDLKAKGSQIRVNCATPGWVQTDMGGKQATIPLEQGGVEPFKAITQYNDVTGMFYSKGIWLNYS